MHVNTRIIKNKVKIHVVKIHVFVASEVLSYKDYVISSQVIL